MESVAANRESHARSVIDGKLLRTSASQIAVYRACPRKWYYQKVRGLPSPESKSQALGTALHAELEDYLRSGDVTKLSPRTKVGVPFLPEWHPGLMVEHPFELTLKGGVVLNGRIDLIDPRDDSDVWVIDHKTSSDPDRYAKSAEELMDDPQAIIYCVEACSLPGRVYDSATFRHVYYASRGEPLSLSSECRFTISELAEKWLRLLDTVESMGYTANTSIDKVHCNSSHCSAYGGCPFVEQCQRERKFTVGSILQQHRAALAAQKKIAQPAPTPPQPTPPVVETKEEEIDEVIPPANGIKAGECVEGQKYYRLGDGEVELYTCNGKTILKGKSVVVFENARGNCSFVDPGEEVFAASDQPEIAPPDAPPVSAEIPVDPPKRRGRPKKSEVVVEEKAGSSSPQPALPLASEQVTVDSVTPSPAVSAIDYDRLAKLIVRAFVETIRAGVDNGEVPF